MEALGVIGQIFCLPQYESSDISSIGLLSVRRATSDARQPPSQHSITQLSIRTVVLNILFFVRVSHAHLFFSSPSFRRQDPRFSRAGVRRAHHRLPQPVGRHRDHHHVQTRGVRQANQEGRLCEIPLQRLSDGRHADRLHVSRPICLHIYLCLYQDRYVSYNTVSHATVFVT